MSKENFIENITEDKLFEIVDKALRYEKNRKADRIGSHWFKIIPAVAAIALVIGLMNYFAGVTNIGDLPSLNGINLGTYANITTPTTTEPPEEPTEYTDPYAHVRFGETRDILLLDIEWHTPETYLEYYGGEQANEIANEIAEGTRWEIRTINGFDLADKIAEVSDKIGFFPAIGIGNTNIGPKLNKEAAKIVADLIDDDGYYICHVYPWLVLISYFDESGEYQVKHFTDNHNLPITVYSKSEFDYVLQEEIIPFLDDLLARGLITQIKYDWELLDPLAKAVEIYFSHAG